MKLILHHLAKDIRAQRWLLVLSFLVIALRIVVDLIEARAGYELASSVEVIRSIQVLPVLGFILWIVLLMRLVQLEPVAGTDSFWLTRPVPRSVYLSSKFLFILFFLIIPYLIPVPLDLLHFGLGRAVIWIELRNDLVVDAYLVVVVLWLATYTRTMSQFISVAIGVVLAVVLGVFGVLYFRISIRELNLGLQSPLVVFVTVSFVGLLVSLLIQHARRQAHAGFIVGVSSVAGALLITLLWPFQWPGTMTYEIIKRDGGGVLWNLSDFYEEGYPVILKFSDDWWQKITWKRHPATGEWTAVAPVSANNLEADQFLEIENSDAKFAQKDAPEESLASPGSSPSPDDCARAIAADFPGVRFADLPTSGESRSFPLFYLFGPVADRIIGKTGVLNIDLYGFVDTLTLEAVIPLKDSPIIRGKGEIVRVARVRGPTRPYFRNGRDVLDVWTLEYMQHGRYLQPPRYYVLIDPESRTGRLLQATSWDGPVSQFAFFLGKRSRHVSLELYKRDSVDRGILYIYKLKESDNFDARLTSPDFTMDPK